MSLPAQLADYLAQGGPVLLGILGLSIAAWTLLVLCFLQSAAPPLAGAVRRRLRTAAVLAALSPLLGLLGTVLGMLETFQAITAHGTGDVGAIADGISRALNTTQAGLVVALTIIPAHRAITRRLRPENLRPEGLIPGGTA